MCNYCMEFLCNSCRVLKWKACNYCSVLRAKIAHETTALNAMVGECSSNQFTSLDTTQLFSQAESRRRASQGVNRIIILNVFRLPQTVADSVYAAQR